MKYKMDTHEETFTKWQNIVDTITDTYNVSDALITKIDDPYLKVFKASKNKDNPFTEGDTVKLAGHYCEYVIENNKKLHIYNAPGSEKWMNYPELDHG